MLDDSRCGVMDDKLGKKESCRQVTVHVYVCEK